MKAKFCQFETIDLNKLAAGKGSLEVLHQLDLAHDWIGLREAGVVGKYVLVVDVGFRDSAPSRATSSDRGLRLFLLRRQTAVYRPK